MNRSKKMVLLSHCILNANSKVEGLSDYKATIFEIVKIIEDNKLGIIQLPCPEMFVEGIKRWGKVKDQYDTLHYREECRKMLMPIIYQVQSYLGAGYRFVGVIGIDGSPSCGVDITCSGDFRGEISQIEQLDKVIDSLQSIDESGVFMEEFKKLLSAYNIELPFIGINENNVYESIEKVKNFIERN